MSVPQKAKFKIDFANASDRGQRRPENFDSFGKFPHDHSDLSTTKGQLFIVADAKSRNPSGRDAGKMSIRIIQENYFAYPSEDPVFSLQRAFDTANRQIFQYAKANGLHRKIGATVSALVLTDKNAYVAHVGDCRVFRVSVKRIDRLTNDHTRVIELQADGKRPARNKTILTRALGIKLGMRIDTSNRLPIHRDEYFLLATDGLSVLSEEEIKNVILSSAPQSACRRLVEMARMRGSRDDITVQIVKLYHQFKEVQIETYAHVDDLEGISNGPILFMLAFMVAMTGFIFRDSLLEKFSGVVASFATEYKLVTVNTDDSPNKMLNDRRLENANYMLRNGRVQEALQSFQQMLRDDPTHNGALDGIYKVAEAYTQQGDRDRQKGRLFEARSSYNQALKLNPNDPVARRRLADMDRREATPPPSSRRGRVKTTIPKLDTRQSSNSYLEKGIKDLGVRGIRRAEWTLNGLDEYQDFQYRRSNLTVYNNIRIKKAFYKESFDSVDVQVQTKVFDGNKRASFGVIFGGKPARDGKFRDFYLYKVNLQGDFVLEKVSERAITQIAQGQIAEGPNRDLNKLTLQVKSYGNLILLYADHEILKMINLPEVVDNQHVGLYSDPGLELEFANFRVDKAQIEDE